MRLNLSLVTGCLLLLNLQLFGASAFTNRWIYFSGNLSVDANVQKLQDLIRKTAGEGYNGMILSDSKFCRLGEMAPHYFQNIEKIKGLAAELHYEIVPTLFPVGYSNDILWHNPNLVEGLPVTNALFVVSNAMLVPVLEKQTGFKGGDFKNLKEWGFVDENMKAVADGGVGVKDPNGKNARISQKITVLPYHQYHFSVKVKTLDFEGSPEVKFLVGNNGLNHAYLGAKKTQDWTEHHVTFNSLSNSAVTLYLGCWGGGKGELSWRDAKLEPAGLVNVIRRPGAPLQISRDGGGEAVVEGKNVDRIFDPLMGTKPYGGCYDVWHAAPVIKTQLPEGTKVRISYYHSVTIYDGQAMICPSEPQTMELLKDQAVRMHQAWHARRYMMSHDEIRVLNWCEACQRRHLDAGAILADNMKQCVGIMKGVAPESKLCVWSDMFDPNHNAHGDYYLVRGSLAGSWEGLPKEVLVVPWLYGKRAESLKWFSDRGHEQVIAGYYDAKPENIVNWLKAAEGVPGVSGYMYTTWEANYRDTKKMIDAAMR